VKTAAVVTIVVNWRCEPYHNNIIYICRDFKSTISFSPF